MKTSTTLLNTALAAILLFGAVSASGQGSNEPLWDFTGENQPDFLDLYYLDGDLSEVGCSELPDKLYENYAILFPEFLPLMVDPALRKQWRISMYVNNIEDFDNFNFCFYMDLRDLLREATDALQNLPLVSCGVAASNLTKEGKLAAEIVDEFMIYGFAGSAFVWGIVLDNDLENDFGIKLNSDVRYLAQLKYNSVTPEEGTLRELAEPHLNPSAGDLLTAERRQFVETAFANNNYQSVLDTTQPC